MCGYLGNLHEAPVVVDLMNQLGIPLPYPVGGHRMMSTAPLISQSENDFHITPAYWNYAFKTDPSGFLQLHNGKPIPLGKYGINARSLHYKEWLEPLKLRRGILLATEIGESQGKGKERKQFLMKSQQGLILGCLYKDWLVKQDGEIIRSFAVITRPPTKSYAEFHSKSMPLLLPYDVIEEWLNPNCESSDTINNVLNNTKLTTDLFVTEVKTYKNAEPLSETKKLLKD